MFVMIYLSWKINFFFFFFNKIFKNIFDVRFWTGVLCLIVSSIVFLGNPKREFVILSIVVFSTIALTQLRGSWYLVKVLANRWSGNILETFRSSSTWRCYGKASCHVTPVMWLDGQWRHHQLHLLQSSKRKISNENVKCDVCMFVCNCACIINFSLLLRYFELWYWSVHDYMRP